MRMILAAVVAGGMWLGLSAMQSPPAAEGGYSSALAGVDWLKLAMTALPAVLTAFGVDGNLLTKLLGMFVPVPVPIIPPLPIPGPGPTPNPPVPGPMKPTKRDLLKQLLMLLLDEGPVIGNEKHTDTVLELLRSVE